MELAPIHRHRKSSLTAALTGRLLRASIVGGVGGGDVDHQQTTVDIDGDLTVRPTIFLAPPKPRLPSAANASTVLLLTAEPGGALRALRSRLIIKTTSWMVRNRTAGQIGETLVDCFPRAVVDRQHMSFTAGANHVADRVHNLAQFEPPPPDLRQNQAETARWPTTLRRSGRSVSDLSAFKPRPSCLGFQRVTFKP